MKKNLLSGFLLIALFFSFSPVLSAQAAGAQVRHLSPELQKAVAETDYASVRIKKFPSPLKAGRSAPSPSPTC